MRAPPRPRPCWRPSPARPRRGACPVVALAPTASAAMVLGEALGTRGDTVARHLLSPERSQPGQPAAWIVDEASLLSARDTARLFDLAEKHDARVILVGDVKQLGSVEAGAAFAQLQDAGMETAKLAEIVRQTNAAAKDAVLASIEGDARKALAALDRGGGRIIENADRAERFAAIAEQYAGLDKAGRARTLVIEPSREGRDALTADIRAGADPIGRAHRPRRHGAESCQQGADPRRGARSSELRQGRCRPLHPRLCRQGRGAGRSLPR